jgi:integrase
MARHNERGLELSFHRASRRWLKIIDGKKVYFGSGKGISDRESYRDAIAKYRDYMDRLETVGEARANAQREADIMMKSAEDADLTPDDLRHLVATGAMPEAVAILIDPKATPPSPAGNDIPALVEAYLGVQRNRRDLTKSNPEALTRKQRLSTNSYRGIEYCVNSFRDYATGQARIATLTDPAQTERLLLGYRQHLESLMISGKISPSTVNAKIVYLSPLFSWWWKARQIAELPRCLDEISKKYAPRPSAKPLAVTAIKKLWKAADGRMKALIALGLNCAMYASEIASLKGKHLVDGYVAKHRQKTGVPYKIKLWPITAKLIEEQRDHTGGNDLLFCTKRGNALVHEGPKCKTDAISQAFAKVVDAAGVEASWSQLRDTSATLLERIATNGRGQVDKSLVSMLLGHADGRTARFYVDQDPRRLPTSKLDIALGKLAEMYDLDGAEVEDASRA